MAIAGTLEIQMLANLARLSADMQKAQTTVGRAMGRVEASVNSAKRALGALGLGISVIAFTRLIKGALDAQDELSKLSQKVGVSVEGLVGLQHAASLSGLSFEGLQKSIKTVSTQMFDASMGLKESQRNFAALGIEIKGTDGNLKSAEAVIIEVADKFAMMRDGTEKTALAVKLFGKAGLDMIPMLNQGSAALAQMVAEGQRLNPTTTESAKQAEIFNDNMERLTKSVGAVGTSLLVDLLPPLAAISEAFARATLTGQGFWKTLFGFATTSMADREAPWKAIAEIEEAIAGQRAMLKAHEESFMPFVFKDDIAILKAGIEANEIKLKFLKSLRGIDSGQTDPGFITQGRKGGAGGSVTTPDDEKAAKARETLLDQQAQAHAQRLVERIERTQEAMTWELNLDLTLTEQQLEAERARQAALNEARIAGYEWEQAQAFQHGQELLSIEAAILAQKLAQKQHERQATASFLGDMSSLMNTQSKKAFEIGKVASIATAVIKGYEAAVSSYAAGAKIGGPWVGAAFAAASIIATANLINNIRSQSFGGSGGGVGGFPVPVAPEQGDSGIAPQGGQGRGGQTTIVNLHGTMFNRQQMRELLEMQNENSVDGSRVVVVEH